MLFCTLTDIIPYICKKKQQPHKYLCMHACQSSKKSDCKYWFAVTNSNLQVTAGKDYVIEQRKGWLNESMFETKRYLPVMCHKIYITHYWNSVWFRNYLDNIHLNSC